MPAISWKFIEVSLQLPKSAIDGDRHGDSAGQGQRQQQASQGHHHPWGRELHHVGDEACVDRRQNLKNRAQPLQFFP